MHDLSTAVVMYKKPTCGKVLTISKISMGFVIPASMSPSNDFSFGCLIITVLLLLPGLRLEQPDRGLFEVGGFGVL